MSNEHNSLPDTFLPHMPDVGRCQAALHELHHTWRLVEASAKMNCPAEARTLLPAVVATRTNLGQLEEALVGQLVSEKVRQVLGEAATRTCYALDLLVRNLFERTADVGFLATDLDLCRFAAGLDGDRAAAQARLAAYIDKYTVYDDILVLAPDGRVLVQADAEGGLAASADPLVAQALHQQGWSETFRATDLRPGQARALVYAQAMRDPASGAPVAVLCLSFRFEHEMAAIFAAYRDGAGRANLLLLDAERRVISSADPLWIPAGVQVPAAAPAQADGVPRVLLFAGREYLAVACASAGYQGYPGPAGWTCQAMVPLDLAFRAAPDQHIDRTEARLLQGLLSHAGSFNPALHALLSSVNAATHAIKRIVWNGKAATGASGDGGDGRLGTILDQITETGSRSDAVFSRSIRDLYRTVLASSMRAAEFTAQLLVDMLDRSLYERANDCRWWALASQLRHGLAEGAAAGPAQVGAVLEAINALYTVYSRLFVYDRDGVVLAASGGPDAVGRRLAPATLAAVHALRSAREHHVEPFAPSPFYDGRPTFVYHAAIRHPERADDIVGGIAIVFDGAVELANMLHAGVAGRAGMQAFFCAPDGRVLCGTDPDIAPGDMLELERTLFDQAGAGAGVSRIVAWRGQYCVAACSAAAGYREFRAGAVREEPVLAVLLQAFGALRSDGELEALAEPARVDAGAEGGRAVALFHAQGALMALDAAGVVEALPFARVKKAPGGGARVGMLDVDLPGQPRAFVWVFDLAQLLGGAAAVPGPHSQVLLVRDGARTAGLLVDDVHSVQQFGSGQFTPLVLAAGERSLSAGLLEANGGTLLIQELGMAAIFARLLGTGAAQAA